jgi:hypothetical protein
VAVCGPNQEKIVAQPDSLPPTALLMNLISGKKITQAIGTVVELGIADQLKDGSLSAAELAARTGAHAPSLYRLMRALAMVGVFAEHEAERFSLTPVGACLRTDVPGSMADMALFQSRSFHSQAWFELSHAVRTGQAGFDKAFGQPVFNWFAENPAEWEVFNRAMTSFASSVARAVAAAYDFSRFARIADVGGGHGALLATVLAHAPEARGIVFDLPHVVAGARPVLEQAGLAARCEALGGDFFQAVPAGCDAYLMKSIIHDWSDEKAIQILRNCAAGLNHGGRVLLVEIVLPAPGVPSFGKLLDLEMLVMTDGGRERTESEYGALFAAAGLRLERIHPTRAPTSVIEAARA